MLEKNLALNWKRQRKKQRRNEVTMIKFIIAFAIVLFNIVLSVENVQLDLLPDFIGYAIMLYGVWKLKKIHSNHEQLHRPVKESMIIYTVAMLISYVICLLYMYGIIVDGGKYVVIAADMILEILSILGILVFLRLLSSLQSMNTHFQVKRMNTLLLVKILCIVCQNIAIVFSVSHLYMSFLVFDMIVNVILLVYMLTSAFTYREKYKNNNT